MITHTVLNDRILCTDGDIIVDGATATDMVQRGIQHICVEELTSELKQYNQFVNSDEVIRIKNKVRPIDLGWNIPDEYLNINVADFINDKLLYEIKSKKLSKKQIVERVERIDYELELFEERNLVPMLQAIIFVINTLKEGNHVWGVGRGSSVSSYVLYLMEVHDIDSVKFDIKITDFLR